MEDEKPKFMYSLHNSGFGGVYFYVSSRCKPPYSKFQELAKKEKLPLHLGEPEAPYMKRLEKRDVIDIRNSKDGNDLIVKKHTRPKFKISVE